MYSLLTKMEIYLHQSGTRSRKTQNNSGEKPTHACSSYYLAVIQSYNNTHEEDI